MSQHFGGHKSLFFIRPSGKAKQKGQKSHITQMSHHCNHFWAGKLKLGFVQSEEPKDHSSNQDELDKT